MHVLYGLTQFESPGLMIPDCRFSDIVDLCDTKRTIERHRDEKWCSGWLSPAILRHGATSRQITDVERMAAWLGLDVDHSNWSLQTLLEYLGSVECVVYSTTRSTSVQPRWRVLLPLSRETSVSEFAGVWKAINHLLDGEVDTKTRNVNRLHYLPARWVGGNNEYHVQSGATLDVDELLAICPAEEPVAYPDIIQEEIGSARAPDGTEILTQAIIDKHVINGQIGGRFFKLLCAAATRFKANGWTLTASELANTALQVSPKDSAGMNRAMSAHREAARAITYIDSRVPTVAEQDKIINKMLWKWQHQEVKTPS